MDKSTQFPSIPQEEDTSVGTYALRDPVVNMTEIPDTLQDRQCESCNYSPPINLPTFNLLNVSLNEHIKRNLPSTTKIPDLKKSKINFNGKTCVREFITQIEEYFLFKNFDENILVGSFSDLLSDTALKWFRSVRIYISSWQNLKAALLKRFDRCDYDYFLEQDLRTKKQKYSESLPDFITDIMDMASRLSSPLLESTLIQIIKHNMLHIYMPYVVGKQILSIEQFLNLGRELEVFVNKSSLSINKPFKQEKFKVNAVEFDNLVCLKCKSSGHSYRNCPSFPGVICFKCHKVGVLTKSCDNCNSGKKVSTESKNGLGAGCFSSI